ncbi:MAG: electron-transfer flavoprotein:ubiquinone oxidoreductase [bacterium]
MSRDTMTFDVLAVGCGAATLSSVLQFLRRVKSAPAGSVEKPAVLIIDKGASIGAHSLSGAVIDPGPLSKLLTPEEFAALPKFSTVNRESYRFLTPGGSARVPWVPKTMRAEGYPIVSVSELARYLAGLCEKEGAEIFSGFAAVELLQENGRINGVRMGDKGIDKNGEHRANFELGPDLMASIVVLGEGSCGFLTEKLVAERRLAGSNPQTYAVGIKELIETPEVKGRAGTIMHTFGYPLDPWTYGGGFVYCVSDTLTAVGMATALDYKNPTINPHDLFRMFKHHPAVMPFIAGGKVLEYGAKVLPEGGFHSALEMVTDGAIIVGDAAGLCNSLRLKGIHLAVQSGIAAGDALFEGWKSKDFSTSAMQKYPQSLKESAAWKELRNIKNVRAGFTYGSLPGMMTVGMGVVTGGALPPGRMALEQDWEAMKTLADVKPWAQPAKPAADEANTQLDKLSDVFFSKTHHEENQPSHLKIVDPEKCKACIQKFGAPCTIFCPAQVYVLKDDKQGIHIDFSNCLHCKTCQIKDPLQNIRWTPPEGGGGPGYSRM